MIGEHENRLAKWFDNWFVTIKEPTTYEQHGPWAGSSQQMQG